MPLLPADDTKPRPTEEAKCLDCCTAVPFGYEEEEVTKLSLCKFVPTSWHGDVDCLHKKCGYFTAKVE